jgi:transcriptional regulator with XRE-family HTH domain
MDLKGRIGHNIAALRHFRGYSVAAFAEKTGMASDRMEKIEAGKIDMDIDEFTLWLESANILSKK